jgi:hypothetical protein
MRWGGTEIEGKKDSRVRLGPSKQGKSTSAEASGASSEGWTYMNTHNNRASEDDKTNCVGRVEDISRGSR